MLNNLGLASFVDRISRDQDLQEELSRDFEGALDKTGMPLTPQDRDALRAAWQFIREFAPGSRDTRVIAGWGIGC